MRTATELNIHMVAVLLPFTPSYSYHIRNGQGDIVKLIDGSGTTVVEYSYDTWGKLLSCTTTLDDAAVYILGE